MVIELAGGLLRRGASVRVIVIENEDNAMLSDVPVGVDLQCLSGPCLLRLLALRRGTRGCVVHLQFWGGHVRPLYRLALLGRPTVITYQAPYPRSRRQHIIDRALSRYVRSVVACSQTVAQWCERTVGIDRRRIRVIHNGSSPLQHVTFLDVNNRAALELVAVTRLVRQKDPQTLIRGFAESIALGLDARLTVVGVGPLMESLLVLAHELRVARRITWLGELWRPELIRSVMRSADVFVTASQLEGFSVALLEAAFEGLSLLVSDIEPHREAMAAFASYFERGNAKSLAKQLVRLGMDPAYRSRIAAAGTRRVANQFSISACIERHLELYAELGMTPSTLGRDDDRST
jgi:glycosyltransferase involved in cell wall biosynthesis